MTERKWTPGPWVWRYEDGGHMEADQWFLSPGVLMADGTDGTPSGDSIDRANARLIAAAPEMYEALEQARDTILELINARNSEAEGSDEDWVGGINATLAKARGETQ